MNTINNIFNSNFISLDTLDSKSNLESDLSSSSTVSFGNYLANSLEQLNSKYLELDEAQKLFTNGDIETHELMAVLRETELMLKTATTIRNKVLDSYKEITNMQI